MDSSWIADMYNWHIPAAGGPPLLIAPFWDDLDPNATDSSGSVCYWYDSSNDRFIVEYSHIQHIHDPTNPTPSELQTFEIILFDPIAYPTASGDGEIIFQYQDITNDDIWHNYSTVGIENKEHTIGLEYSFDNIYGPGAAVLANNRAIKFTTDPPDTFPGIEENGQMSMTEPLLAVYPNPSRKIVKINFSKELSAKAIVLKIYDVAGRSIKTFKLPTAYPLLPTSLSWDGTNDLGQKIPTGIYFLHLKADELNIIEKIILMK